MSALRTGPLLLMLASCGQTTSTLDASSADRVAALDIADVVDATDVGDATDAIDATDATDATDVVDANGCPSVAEPPSPMGQCDGRGRIACEMWAQGIAGGRPNVTAQCVSAPAGCVRADRCDDASDPATCRCGVDPACGPNEVCALVGPTARCQCARL